MNKKILMSLFALGTNIFCAEAYFRVKETPDLWMLADEAAKRKSEVESGYKHECRYCNEKFKTYEDELFKHMYLNHYLERPFACEICHVNFESKDALKRHQKSQRHCENAAVHESGLPDLTYLNK